jgi:hypothetical protein
MRSENTMSTPKLNPTAFLQSLPVRWRQLRFAWRARSRAARAARAARLGKPVTVKEGPFVGWFDSSHDLLHGVAITEHGDDLVLL